MNTQNGNVAVKLGLGSKDKQPQSKKDRKLPGEERTGMRLVMKNREILIHLPIIEDDDPRTVYS